MVASMDLSFVDARAVLVVLHLLGAATGIGGAILSDTLFFRAARDGRLSSGEFGVIVTGSHAVTAGLLLLILSGIGLFSLDPARYLASAKFLAKMTIVGILSLNGIVLHRVHIPRLKALVGRSGPRGLFPGKPGARLLFIVSGVVSLVSWVAALTLGSMSVVPLRYEEILTLYAAVLVPSLGVGFLLRNRLFP